MNMDERLIMVLFLGTLLLIILAVFIVAFIVQYTRRQNMHTLEKAALQSTFDNQLLQSRLEVQEQSFQYFSEEIHDNVGQVLSVVGMQIYQLQDLCKDEHASRLARQSSELLNKAITDLRTISHTLNAQYIGKAGLVETLRQEIDYVNSVKAASCTLDVSGEIIPLPPDREILLFRIIQEALANALKHAKADKISIGLAYSPGQLSVTINDNGSGFDPELLKTSSRGLGLTNMQLRAGLLGGQLLVISSPGKGSKISLLLSTQIPHVRNNR